MAFSQFEIPSFRMMAVCIKLTKASQKTVRTLTIGQRFQHFHRKINDYIHTIFFSESSVKNLLFDHKCQSSSNCLPLTLSLPYTALLLRAFKSEVRGTIEV